MSSATITVVPYRGTQIPSQLLIPDTRLETGAFGRAVAGTVLSQDGLTTFNGTVMRPVGTGAAQASGVEGPGPEAPLLVFEAGGQLYFHYPDGPPQGVDPIAIVINIDAVPEDGIMPACFTLGTLISTPEGEVPVEDLAPGDRVLAIDGSAQVIQGLFRRRIRLDTLRGALRHRLLPVLLPKDALGRGLPHRDLRLSQQHLVCLEHAAAQLYFDEREVLVPAKALVGDHICLDHATGEVTYVQILCDRHVVVRGNGLPVETLRIGQVGAAPLSRAQRAELMICLKTTAEAAEWMPAALPVLSTAEGRVLRAAMASRRKVH
ncbi:Hint domain-containing protein [Pseudooceanicola sp. 502str34]